MSITTSEFREILSPSLFDGAVYCIADLRLAQGERGCLWRYYQGIS